MPHIHIPMFVLVSGISKEHLLCPTCAPESTNSSIPTRSSLLHSRSSAFTNSPPFQINLFIFNPIQFYLSRDSTCKFQIRPSSIAVLYTSPVKELFTPFHCMWQSEYLFNLCICTIKSFSHWHTIEEFSDSRPLTYLCIIIIWHGTINKLCIESIGQCACQLIR